MLLGAVLPLLRLLRPVGDTPAQQIVQCMPARLRALSLTAAAPTTLHCVYLDLHLTL